MAESGESRDAAIIDARKAQQPKITQVMDKSFNPFLNINMPKMKLGLPVKLSIGISVLTATFMGGFACGYVAASRQQDSIKDMVQKALDESKEDESKEFIKAVDERQLEFIVKKVFAENKKMEETKIEKGK